MLASSILEVLAQSAIVNGMREYFDFCPISKASEILAERWAPLVIRELIVGANRFTEIQRGIPSIPSASLSQRLKMLEDKGIVMRWLDAGGRPYYQLTPTGAALEPVIKAIGTWGQYWLNQDIREEDLDLRVLMWDIHRRINVDELPEGRTVVQVEFSGTRTGRFWLLLQRPTPEVCDVDPVMPVDLYVAADAMTMTRVWMGRLPIQAALESGSIDLIGESHLVTGFPSWLALNFFAPAARVAD